MIKRWIFLIVLVVLGIVLAFYPNFKTVGAGVSILLFGMITLEEGFKVFTKGPLRNLLRLSTNKLYKSISLGAAITAIIQSSSLVSVITISFISAGLITLSSGIGLIFGANIGTTATAWLVAGFGLKVQISALAMPMLIFGILFSFQNEKTLKGLGSVLAGLGFFFLGIHYMKEGFEIFSAHLDLTAYAVTGFLGILIYTGIGIFITSIMQSSSASLALILTALAAGQITYENSLALAIGSNIGTTITAVIGSIGSNIAGKRLALAHLIFNLLTGLFALVIIGPLARLVAYLSGILGIAPDDYTLQLALFHTLFNVLGVLLMLPFIKKLEELLLRFIRDRGDKDKDIDEPKFLNKAVLEFPGTVISSLEKETRYLFENAVFEIVAHAVNIHRKDIQSDLKPKHLVKKSKSEIDINVRELYMQKVKNIYGLILEYATKAQSDLNLSEEQNKRIAEIKIANRKMVEIILDVKELRHNVNEYMYSDNKHMQKEYNKFRRTIVEVYRVIYSCQLSDDLLANYNKLLELKETVKSEFLKDSEKINDLIRQGHVTPFMSSSLVNDHDNVDDIIKKLIQVGELLYSRQDTILEPR